MNRRKLLASGGKLVETVHTMPKTPTANAATPATMELTPDLVATTIRIVEDEGPEPNWNPISPEQLDDLVSRVEEEAGDGEIWVFAYGSLMWNPGFEVAASEEASLTAGTVRSH
ncbi:hypothetical protein GCM10010520_52300 [Rhizobium viscosum]|uniref:Gamma-glutamylcyclotransferase n=1 Tax=Rhizobium viscosum TaxID=1673 RepID=A0ABR9IZ33_RHIVS|nr:hypothetical protein [Rhizobium viscosum]